MWKKNNKNHVVVMNNYYFLAVFFVLKQLAFEKNSTYRFCSNAAECFLHELNLPLKKLQITLCSFSVF